MNPLTAIIFIVYELIYYFLNIFVNNNLVFFNMFWKKNYKILISIDMPSLIYYHGSCIIINAIGLLISDIQ